MVRSHTMDKTECFSIFAEKLPRLFKEQHDENRNVSHGFQQRERTDFAFQLGCHRGDGEQSEAQRDSIVKAFFRFQDGK